MRCSRKHQNVRCPFKARGRVFTSVDNHGSAKVAIVSAAFVRQGLTDQNPIGQHLTLGNLDQAEIVGDRIQFTAPANEVKVANRELATIESIHENGRLRLKMDGGRAVEVATHKRPHLDYGYAMTSHSSQGQTADRVLIHVDTELGAEDLLNSRMAYVSVSRGRYDAQIYTNNAATLGQELSRDVSHSPAIQQEPVAHKLEPQTTHTNQISRNSSGCSGR